MNKNSKIAVFGANGFLGSSFCNYLTRENKEFLAISRKANNINNYKNYLSLDLIEDNLWTNSFINELYQYKTVIFFTGIAHKKEIDPYEENLKIFSNFKKNFISNFKDTHNLIFISTLDIRYLKKNSDNFSYFPISYAKSKKECEKVLIREFKNFKILRLPFIFSLDDKKDLYKRISINFLKYKLFFRIFPSPIYELLEINKLNQILLNSINSDFSKKIINAYDKSSQFSLLRNESRFYFPVPRFVIFILMKVMQALPSDFSKSRSLNLDKLINYTTVKEDEF